MLERDVQGRCVAFARRLGVIAHKFSSEGKRHVPDYLFFYRGWLYLVEYKATGKSPRDGQVREIEIFRAQGFTVDVVDEVVEGNRLMRDFVDRADALTL